MSVVPVALAAILLVAAAPGLPARRASITLFDQIGDHGAGELGFVTVGYCARVWLYHDWSCRGTFQVNDPMAEPYRPTPDVRVANDLRWHRPGTTVG